MIETIYSRVNNEDLNKGFVDASQGFSTESNKPEVSIRLPKNIKQIGQGSSNMNCQIYIEENVLLYIKRNPHEESDLRYGVLLGEKRQANGYTYIFINGVIDAENVIDHTIIFSDDIWTEIYDNLKRYYKNSDIVGWFASSENDLTKDMHSIKKVHLDHFAGNGKVYLNINRDEAEEAFYLYERNGLRRQPCYHVYFEKRSEFEDYLFGMGLETKEEEVKGDVKEGGKYGIALNNVKSNNSSTTGKAISSAMYSRVASFATILLLAGVLYYMGSNGQLNILTDKMKGVVGDIVGNEQPSEGNIISVNGNLAQTTGDEVAIGNEETSSIKEVANGETSTEEISGGDTTLEENSTEETSGEKVTTVGVEDNEESSTKEASISVPNENHEVYIVKSGDTLYSIALNQCGSADMVDEIMSLNKLDNKDYVIEGQKLLLP